MSKMRQWTMLTAVAAVLVLAAGWFLLVKPQSSHASSLRASAASQQQDNASLQAQISQLEAEQKGLPKAQAELQKFATQVPDNAQEPTIIRQLSGAARASDVQIITLTPGTSTTLAAPTATTTTTTGSTSLTATGATPTTALVELPVSIGITGSYANVESFFLGLEKLPRSILITGWSLCPETPSSSSSSASCSPPTVPASQTVTSSTLGGTLSANFFYAPPASTVASTTLGTTTPTTPTTATPSTTPSVSPSTTPTTPTAGSAAPAS
jgi:Tfp pilus assembly protein PilO